MKTIMKNYAIISKSIGTIASTILLVFLLGSFQKQVFDTALAQLKFVSQSSINGAKNYLIFETEKKMKKYTLPNIFYILLLLPLLSSFQANAQTKQKWFRQEYGFAQSTVYDNGQSLAKHTGSGLYLNLGGETDRPKSYSKLDNALMITFLNAKITNEKYATSAQQGNFRMSYTYLRKLAKTQDRFLKLAFGGSVFVDANVRIYSALSNNNLSWDGNVGLNVMGKAQHDFSFKNHSFSITYQLGFPIIAYNLRPNYLGIIPLSATFEGKNGKNLNWQSLGRFVGGINDKYLYINQQINLDKINANGNRIRLSYTWNYANNGFATHRYQNIMSGLSIGVLTNFSKQQMPSK
jgi:hypothetical protein